MQSADPIDPAEFLFDQDGHLPANARQTILVVDDQPTNVHALHQIFSSDHEVLVATNGQDGLNLARSRHPDLILLDIVMPDLDGKEVCRQLKAAADTADIPVIFITGNTDTADEVAALALAAVDFIRKPFEPLVVRARVQVHLELRQKNQQLLASRSALALAATAFSHTSEGIIILDTNGLVIAINKAFETVSGRASAQTIGRAFKDWELAPGSRYGSNVIWEQMQDTGFWNGEILCLNQNGSTSAQLLNINQVLDEAGRRTHFVVNMTDITRLKGLQKELESMANFDALTGLPNRVLLADRMRQAMTQHSRRGKALAVCYLDLDGFKAVNDNYGHNYGDELLIALSNRLRKALRDGDTLARIGGDEFVAIASDISSDKDRERVLARLLRAASDPIHVKDAELQVSASIGVAIYPKDADTQETLMHLADQAMYVAKQLGKNRSQMYSGIMDGSAENIEARQQELQKAVANKELVLHYLPRVSMRTGNLNGYEALLRWSHPRLGSLLPSDFLADHQNSPLMIQLTDWVIGESLQQLERWRATELDHPISINLSGFDLFETDLAQRLALQLKAHPSVAPSSLQLEIQERVLMQQVDRAASVLKSCAALGVGFTIDNFGTGYATAAYLRKLPCSAIKIDRSFASNLINDSNSQSVVRGVLGLAKAYGCKVIADGVESFSVSEVLRRMGCDSIQGHYIAPAMRAGSIANWLPDWSAKVRLEASQRA